MDNSFFSLRIIKKTVSLFREYANFYLMYLFSDPFNEFEYCNVSKIIIFLLAIDVLMRSLTLYWFTGLAHPYTSSDLSKGMS